MTIKYGCKERGFKVTLQQILVRRALRRNYRNLANQISKVETDLEDKIWGLYCKRLMSTTIDEMDVVVDYDMDRIGFSLYVYAALLLQTRIKTEVSISRQAMHTDAMVKVFSKFYRRVPQYLKFEMKQAGPAECRQRAIKLYGEIANISEKQAHETFECFFDRVDKQVDGI